MALLSPTQNDKQPTVEVISMYGQKHNYLNDDTGYLDFDKMKSFYDKGFTILMADVLDFNRGTKRIRKRINYKNRTR